MVEGRMLTQRQDSVLEVHTNHCCCLRCEFPPGRRCNDGGRQNEPLERTKTNPVGKLDKVEVPEDIPFAAIDAISKPVC